MLPVVLAPILTDLVKNGLSLLANAVSAKGKDFIEERVICKYIHNM